MLTTSWSEKFGLLIEIELSMKFSTRQK